MVLFSNININQRVEIEYQNRILNGTVRYKGAINSQDGDWVGVELDAPIGKHDGLYKGVKYFECKDRHGVFVRANSLRFIRNTKRKLFDKYYTHGNSVIDEVLFGNTKKSEESADNFNNPAQLSNDFNRRSTSDLFDTLGSRYSSSPSFHLTGSVSRQLPAATMTRPFTAAAQFTYTSKPIHSMKRKERNNWEPVASIPKTHMPLSAQRNQTLRGWDNAHWTRELSYPKARQSMKTSVWNDVSF